jgi:glycosyltransferase involved in cell wall biosynthesis
MRPLVFVPMYRCAPQIVRVVAQIAQAPEGRLSGAVFVDNQSPDSTIQACRAAIAANGLRVPWRIFRNDGNYGLGGSHKVAFELARREGHDGIVVLHGDDQATLADLWPALDADDGRAECLLGSRFARGARLQGYSTLRTAGNLVFNGLFSAVTHQWLTDLGSGLNLYRRSFLERGLHMGGSDTLSFNYYLLLASCARGASLRFFPISWREEDQRSNVKMLRQAIGMLGMLARYVRDPDAFVQAGLDAHAGKAYPSTLVAEGRP